VQKHLAAVIFIVFLLGTAQVSDALIYEFNDSGVVPFSAVMDISVSGNSIHIKLNNTSPVKTQTSDNIPAIIGFGFGLTNYNSSLMPITWIMQVFDINKTLVTVGQDGGVADWRRSGYGDNNIFMIAATSQGGLYDPLANVYNLSSAYLTTAYLDMTFSAIPILDVAVNPNMKVIPPGGQNSFYVEGQSIPTPEPGTLLLLGIGLIGIGIVMRELF
jgi:hypothetical protein